MLELYNRVYMYKSTIIEKIYCIILIHVTKKFSEVLIIKDNAGLIKKNMLQKSRTYFLEKDFLTLV